MELTLDGLSYTYTKNASFTLGPVSLGIATAQVTALIGSNGSGKTTLIKVLLNELTNYHGTYRIDDSAIKDVTGSLMHRFGIGYAPENPVLEERLSGFEIMHLLKEIHDIPDTDFSAQIDECRKAFHLEAWFETTPCRECSQGMRKKISLMMALIGAPQFIIIDEPTNGLDPIAVFGLKTILSRRQKAGHGALVSSHMLDFVERVADEVIILKKGKTAFAGTVGQIFATYPEKRLDEIYYHLFMQSPEVELHE
jgi:ABC-type multidrug transport system ATPase subunit